MLEILPIQNNLTDSKRKNVKSDISFFIIINGFLIF